MKTTTIRYIITSFLKTKAYSFNWRLNYILFVFFSSCTFVFSQPISKENLLRDFAYFKSQLKQNSQDVNILFDMATIQYYLQNHEMAKKFLSQVLFYNPNDADAVIFLGKIHRQTGELHLANETLKRAISLAPQKAEAWYERGLVFADLGQFDDAIKALQKTLVLSPQGGSLDLSFLRFYIGLVALEKGDKALARREEANLKKENEEYSTILQDLINLSN